MLEDIIILHLCTTNDNMIYGSWDMELNRIFCHFGPFFALLPLSNQKIKILKKWKNAWRYFHFTLAYHKWQPYHVWFLRYEAQHNFLFILKHFLHLPHQKIKILKTLKKQKNTGYIIILHKYTKNHVHILYCSWDDMWWM